MKRFFPVIFINLDQVRKLRTAFPSVGFPEMENDHFFSCKIGKPDRGIGQSHRKAEVRDRGTYFERISCRACIPHEQDEEKSCRKEAVCMDYTHGIPFIWTAPYLPGPASGYRILISAGSFCTMIFLHRRQAWRCRFRWATLCSYRPFHPREGPWDRDPGSHPPEDGPAFPVYRTPKGSPFVLRRENSVFP